MFSEKDKKILILGITSVSIAIYNNLKESYKIFLWDISEKIRSRFKDNYNIIDTIENTSFNDYDFIILSKDILIAEEDFKTLMERLFKIEDKVLLDVEFLCRLYPNNKYVATIGSGYNYIVSSILSGILNDANVVNFNCSSFEERNFVEKDPLNNRLEDVVVLASLRKPKINYIKQLNLDIIAVLDDDDNIKNIKEKVLLKQDKNSIILLNMDNEKISELYDDLEQNTQSKIIPLSITKILNNGVSYVGGTIYDYYNNKNESYDINTNLCTDTTKLSILCAFVMAAELKINLKAVEDYLSTFNGINNYLEYIGQVENIRFINNIEANNTNSILAPYSTYSNLYSIILVNGKQSKTTLRKKFVADNNKVFIVDIHNLFNEENVRKFDDLKTAFDAAIMEAKKEEKETEIVILLTPIFGDDMNSIYYAKYGEEFKNLFKDFKKDN